MTTTIDARRQLYGALFATGLTAPHPRAADDPGVDALEAMLERVEALQRRLDAAYSAARARGETGAALFKEVRRATFLAGALRDLLIEAEDDADEIADARGQIDAASDRLDGLSASAAGLADDLGAVKVALDSVAKLLKLLD